jgi:hypothetical protein
MTDQASSLLDRTLAATRGFGARARVGVSAGSPPDGLFALGAGVDLLVIGSSRSRPVGRVSVGSTGNALVGAARGGPAWRLSVAGGLRRPGER